MTFNLSIRSWSRFQLSIAGGAGSPAGGAATSTKAGAATATGTENSVEDEVDKSPAGGAATATKPGAATGTGTENSVEEELDKLLMIMTMEVVVVVNDELVCAKNDKTQRVVSEKGLLEKGHNRSNESISFDQVNRVLPFVLPFQTRILPSKFLMVEFEFEKGPFWGNEIRLEGEHPGLKGRILPNSTFRRLLRPALTRCILHILRRSLGPVLTGCCF